MKSTTVPFELKSGLIVVEAHVNGSRRRFIVDTGASHTIITERTAETLALEPDTTPGRTAVGARGSTTAKPVTVRSFVWGDVELVDITLMQVAMDNVCGMAASDVAGVIGYDILSRFRLTVDYGQRHLLMEPATLAPNR